ncbi:hypothetical protein H7U37_08610 [Pseudoflavonifractor phocaeensis]|uniref:hypothetical protein n=1 Tax=Pseudoflavonifractor phocaeensis TaxID=1870988 RepID=UPI00195DAEC6|nr:hypothetical protein [Pseudoflavonifractor phocaeensis]MBM6869578.1 hypothetical protein [Pseudoflavonifractor phocaeensis]MBM6938582.1 hypothetical protein [Pseudoflavonifractor phocaeensis]
MGRGAQTRRLAAGAVLTALSLAVLFGSCYLPTGRMGLVAAAGLLPAAAVISAGGIKAGLLCYGASGLLALLLLPDKGNALLYLLFFGLYPMVKSAAERLAHQWQRWLGKLAFFYGMLSVLWFLAGEVLTPFLPAALDSTPLVYGVGTAVFVVYDYGFTKLIGFYMARVHRYLFR